METSERHIKRIVLERMDRCSVCHRSFEPDDVHVLSRKPDVWMMVVQCEDCQARNFVAALIGDSDPAEARSALQQLSIEHRSEVSAIEPESEAPGPIVDADDLLDMHEFLQDFDGDFLKHFAKG